MGGAQSINYAEAVTEKKEGETAIYRYPGYKNGLLDSPTKELKTMKDILVYSSIIYAKNNALGTITKENDKNIIKYRTYGEFFK